MFIYFASTLLLRNIKSKSLNGNYFKNGLYLAFCYFDYKHKYLTRIGLVHEVIAGLSLLCTYFGNLTFIVTGGRD